MSPEFVDRISFDRATKQRGPVFDGRQWKERKKMKAKKVCCCSTVNISRRRPVSLPCLAVSIMYRCDGRCVSSTQKDRFCLSFSARLRLLAVQTVFGMSALRGDQYQSPLHLRSETARGLPRLIKLLQNPFGKYAKHREHHFGVIWRGHTYYLAREFMRKLVNYTLVCMKSQGGIEELSTNWQPTEKIKL